MKKLFTSLKGRIRRWHWWAATLFITLIDYALSIPLLWLIGGDPNYYWNDALPTKEVALADITAFLATLHFSLAVDIKRIHDRGRSAYLLVPLYLFSLALIFSQSLNWSQGISWLITNELNGTLPFEAYVLATFFVIILTYSLWMLIELGLGKGTTGESKYGPDPLPPQQSGATAVNWTSLFFSLKGRINRRHWWIGNGLFILALILFYGGGWLIGYVDYDAAKNTDDAFAEQTIIPGIIFSFVTAFFLLALFTKRLHDLGKSGWWSLLLWLPSYFYSIAYLLGLAGTASQPNNTGWGLISVAVIIGVIALFYLGASHGQKGENLYGADPLPPEAYTRPAQSLASLIFALKGRLSRSQYAIGIASALGIAGGVFLIFAMLLSLAMTLQGAAYGSLPDAQIDGAIDLFMATTAGYFLFGFLALGFLLLLYNLFAVSTKRLHDRNRRGWWLWLPVLPIVPALLAPLSIPPLLVLAIIFPIALWLFIEMAFLKGAPADNRFGPDPLAPLTPPPDETI